MRLFLIPISTRRALIYARPLRKDIAKELSMLDRVTTKAAQQWAKWEEAESGWKKQLVTWGNKVQQRIPFEEWGLKSIPSLKSQQKVDKEHGSKKIDLLFPGNAVHVEKIPSLLHKIATERQEFHKSKMRWSLGTAPLTAPFALIPVIPNIPFFYLVYRGWSHWRALNGSRHLEYLVDKKLLNPISLSGLEQLYSKRTSSALDNTPINTPAAEMIEDIEQSEERVLLKMSDAKELANILDAPELALEAERAIVQVGEQLEAQKAQKKAQQSNSDEKKGS
ncbi:hypothetical protein N7468_002508 [Penicillium chermesinum]|uniref:Mitochondrial K+-H+ exchange-related-domain-containing protein n=1 Tax=Penicillium chermesinum TaxID=63820 RepID=A0A9W9TXP6_9EURO|nr:uncharacterized protein N7468_002508 [Penicillium chermesinum]KAJ5247525.1 hypothetical protein N7468_002508 [Penicillium chermesinum]